MARLIRTEKEVEGRYEEVWLVVEEDALDQWPAGPLEIVGRPATRVTGPLRARGEARYTADLRLPGMLHAAVLRSPHAYARANKIDFERALAATGVRAAIGPGDVDALTDEPGFQGQAVAAIAADTYAQARAALDLVELDWDVREPLIDPDEAVRRGQLVGEPSRYERGDVDKALAEADVVVQAEYRTQTVLHNSFETHQSVCEWRGDSLDVYISTQFIWGIRDEVAGQLGLPPDKVRVVCEFMGGGFGSKNSAGDHTFVAAELAKRTGRPVRCALTRREENLATGNRNSTIQRLTAAAKSDGTLVALAGEYVNATGWSGWPAPTDGPMQMLYDCENVRTVLSPAKVNTPPMRAFRAPGFVEGTFGLECLLDELAARLDLDPLELRRRNYAHSTDDRPFSSKNLMECYKRAEPHWQRRDEVRARSEGPWKRGIGLASQIWYGGGGPPSYAWVRVGSDGRATVVTAMQDIGTGTATAMTQIAAEELGLPLDRVDLVLGDSARGPYASISAGSSTTPSMGPAVRSAAADAARQIVEIAAQRYDKEERILALKGGKVVSADGGSWPIEEVVGLLEDAQILGKGARGPNPTGMQVLTFGVQVAEVAVDVETGEIRVERVAAIHDVGRVVNPLGASSQVEGGIIQGIGHTLSEDRLLEPVSATVLTQSLDAYKLPTIAALPEIVTELLDIPDEHLTNLGSKGLGEPPIVPTAAAIANAIRDATGADVRSLPITREEMLRALREAREREKEKRAAPAAV
ncbi:MAG: xanthine dehydrogenase family protein molybdopterin-binding subunit [Actinobacteria bacterium]|nr:MAG: xanthine dehydrogenase family protein molybdopterin-binding subunit [Actinomycetota bacterium]